MESIVELVQLFDLSNNNPGCHRDVPKCIRYMKLDDSGGSWKFYPLATTLTLS
jgi:hypothetical protein